MKTGFRNKGKVLARFDKVPLVYRNAARTQGTIEVEKIVSTMKRFAPEDHGVLKSTIKFDERHRADKLLWVIKAGGPATTKVVRKSAKGNAPEFDYAVGVEHGTTENPAQPYFYPAYRLHKKKAKRRIKAAARKALREV
ncbi:hypothetical protein [Asticcacaulis excentricus]|uniref:HK97 family phage protein n=1 Tax=Asticcacaulis excentricus (strain ATCC 15261 / DSM 4724 / KCTC 12464 / NCIMB 9791 / VKM B-1370 / CB 48) TaxID=573065 RepID=E8RPQ7_ASTEC|nr:hypothetical protein [Asticcacaulis excentricus]ADU12034.1 HK97 family phage protein [Asticcacaulis excentricus CB 48]